MLYICKRIDFDASSHRWIMCYMRLRHIGISRINYASVKAEWYTSTTIVMIHTYITPITSIIARVTLPWSRTIEKYVIIDNKIMLFYFVSSEGRIMPRKKYDPRAIAKAPKKLYTWESVTRMSRDFKIPKGRQNPVESRESKTKPQANYSYADRTKQDQEKRREQRNRGRGTKANCMLNKLRSITGLISDPRRRPTRDVKEPDHKLNSILHYLNWVTYEAIPCKEKNIQYILRENS